MLSDHIFSRLQGLAVGRPPADDTADMPPDAYAAWKKDGLTFGKFVTLAELGRGGSSVVYRAWQAGAGREVALKVVSGLDPELRERFQREVRIASSLSHPGILPVFESGESAGSLWVSMPLVKGQTLDRCELSFREAALAVAAAARAVQAAHEAGVIHRDLKPRNLMKEPSGVRVMDFGLARTGGESTRLSVTGQILGTPQYMSPEQAAGLPSDERTDVYGLGATLYRLAAGRPPYESETLTAFLQCIATTDPPAPSRAGRTVPSDLETVILQAMERDPSRRYRTAAALADDLERFARSESVAARRTSAPVRWVRVLRRRPIELLAAVSLLLLVVVSIQAFPRTERHGDSSGPGTGRVPTLEQTARELEFKGDMAAAIEVIGHILEKEPGNRWALQTRSHCYARLGRWKEQEADLDALLMVDPENYELVSARASCRFSREDMDGAMADLDHALALRHGSPEILMLRAQVYVARRNLAAAIDDENAAVRSDPQNAFARASRALVWVRAGRLDDAITEYDEAIRLGGKQAKWVEARGRAKLMNRDGAGALEDLEKAVDIDPSLEKEVEADVAGAKQLVAERKNPESK